MAQRCQQRRSGYRKIPGTAAAPHTDVVMNSYPSTLAMSPDVEKGFNAVMDIMKQGPQYGHPPEPSCIIDGVYLGTTSEAENLLLLKRLKITHLLNCAGYLGLRDQRSQYYSGEKYITAYDELYAEDTVQYDICGEFLRAHRLMDRARAEGGRVLVYCPDVNRSSAVTLGYLVRQGTHLLRAVHLVQARRRGRALYNAGFVRQLVVYAGDRDLLYTDREHMAARPRAGLPRAGLRPRDAHLLQVF